jgi:hypothetical protein
MRDELALLREARPDAAGPSPQLARATRRKLLSEIAVPGSRRRKLPRRAVLIAASAAVAAAVLVGVTLSGRSGGTAWAAPLVELAETAPRLLVDTPGWNVTRADEFGSGYGEMTFSNGERRLDLHWERGADFGRKLGDPHSDTERLGTTAVQGATVRLFRYAGSSDFVATWSQGGYGLQARGVAPDLGTFTDLVGTLHGASVDTWLSAMPESVVKPNAKGRVVLAMLEGVPLPPRFDIVALLRTESQTVLDRYQLGAHVTGAVACAWLDRWVVARRTGDRAAIRQAIGALKTSHQWRALREMQAEGAYPRVLWQYADAAAKDGRIEAGKQLTVEESYGDVLGCKQGEH